jgi:large subunit ribosomal protein L25
MVKCMPEEIPEALEIDVTHMEIGNSIHLADIRADYAQLEFLDDEHVTLAHVSPPKKLEVFEEEAEEAAEEAAEGAEGEAAGGEQEAAEQEE